MRDLNVDDVVRLATDLPELQLRRGDLGIIRSKWCHGIGAIEVEFLNVGLESRTRALLLAQDVVPDEEAAHAMQA